MDTPVDRGGADTALAGLTAPHRRGQSSHLVTELNVCRRPVTMVISDIDEVLLSFDQAVLAGIEARHGLPPGRMRQVLYESPTAAAATIGMLDQQARLAHARQTLPGSVVDEWLAYHGIANQSVIELLRRARRAGLRVVLLANGLRRLRDDLGHHDLTGLADAVYLSAEIGYAKPDPRAWYHVLRHHRTEPDHAFTIDTNPASVHASRHLGMHAHHYIDLRRERIARPMSKEIGVATV